MCFTTWKSNTRSSSGIFLAVLRWTAEPAGSLSLGSSGEAPKRRLLEKSAGGNKFRKLQESGTWMFLYFLSYILPSPLSCPHSGYPRNLIRALKWKVVLPTQTSVVHAGDYDLNSRVIEFPLQTQALALNLIQEWAHSWPWSMDYPCEAPK